MSRIFRRISGYARLLRPELAAMDITLPLISAVLAVERVNPDPLRLPANTTLSLTLVVVASYCATVASYVFNDFVDVDIDRVNLPDRPLPSGKLTRIEAFIFALVLYGLSILIFSFFNWYSVAAVVIAALLITSYSAFFKRRTPLSFIPVGIAYGLVPVGVWLAFGPPQIVTYLLAAMICITDWGFTLSGVSRDVEGDRTRGAPTLPVTCGIPFTAKFVFLCWTAGVVFTLAIWHAADLGLIYLAGALACGVYLLWNAAQFVRDPTPQRGGRLFLQSANYRSILFLLIIADEVFWK
jgi:4-hydroxybenzoate polyprenyltransferase